MEIILIMLPPLPSPALLWITMVLDAISCSLIHLGLQKWKLRYTGTEQWDHNHQLVVVGQGLEETHWESQHCVCTATWNVKEQTDIILGPCWLHLLECLPSSDSSQYSLHSFPARMAYKYSHSPSLRSVLQKHLGHKLMFVSPHLKCFLSENIRNACQ